MCQNRASLAAIRARMAIRPDWAGLLSPLALFALSLFALSLFALSLFAIGSFRHSLFSPLALFAHGSFRHWIFFAMAHFDLSAFKRCSVNTWPASPPADWEEAGGGGANREIGKKMKIRTRPPAR